jgi:nickel/cobalt transporter (NiCoT) family protein
LVGTVEILGLIGRSAHLSSPFWTFVDGFNINTAGFVIVGLFVVTWLVALAYWRFAGVEERWRTSAQRDPLEEPVSA